MEGDEITSPMKCENFIEPDDLCPEPDSGPWYCDFVEEEPSPDGDRDYRGPSCTISKRTEPDAPF
jgi:hypothetical protein